MKLKRVNSQISLFKWIWQSYLYTALIPLVLVELIFVGIYFFANNWSQKETVRFLKNEAKIELAQISKQEAYAIENKIMSISNSAELYRRQVKDALLSPISINAEDQQRLAYSPKGVYYTTSDKKDGTILALPKAGEKDWGLDELTNHDYNEAILKDTFKPDQFNLYKRENLSVFAKAVKGDKSGFSTIDLNNIAQVVSWDTIADTGWKLLIIAPENNIYYKVNEMRDKLFQIGTYMIVGLVCFYSIFFFILSRKAKKMSLNISQPLLEINEIVKKIVT